MTPVLAWAAAAALAASTTLAAAPPAATEQPAELPTCRTIDSLNCAGTFTNTIRGGHFCRQLNDAEPRCETYWPLRDPTVNAHSAPRRVRHTERIERLLERIERLSPRR